MSSIIYETWDIRMTLCAQVKAIAHYSLTATPLKQDKDTYFFFIPHHYYTKEFMKDAVNYRWGQCHWRQMPASITYRSPSFCTPQPPPLFLTNSLAWPWATGRPSLIRGADRTCPQPDPSSLEHVNLPVTHTGTYGPTYVVDIPTWRGVLDDPNIEIWATNLETHPGKKLRLKRI